MPSQKRIFGDIGEKIAEKYLKEKGYKILEKNYLKPYGEIDLVSLKRNLLVFFEVKTRDIKNTKNFLAEYSVNKRKIQRLKKTCQIYLIERKYPVSQEWQIDVISIAVDKETKKAKIKHFENFVWETIY